MEAKDIKKKGMNGVKMVIFGRTLIVLGAFLIQFLFVYLLYRTLEEHSLEVYGLFRILMVVVLLHLLSSSGNPEFRLVWMLPMVIFPVFGAVFYLYITIDPGAGKIYERLQKLSVFTRKCLEEDGTAKETLEREDVQVGRLAEYMRKNANCAVYHKTHADYYPLGEDQFEALMEDLRGAQKFIFMEYFIIKEGYLWHEVLEVLKEKVQQGVEVRVMYDGMCALSLLPEFVCADPSGVLQPLQQPGSSENPGRRREGCPYGRHESGRRIYQPGSPVRSLEGYGDPPGRRCCGTVYVHVSGNVEHYRDERGGISEV